MGLNPSVDVENLGFHFATRSVFLGLNLQLGPGLTWLRGRNGRGKTTLLKLLGGALAPSRGHIRLDGLDSAKDALAYRRLSFYCGGEAPALDWLTAREWLELHLALYADADRDALGRHLDAFQIADIGSQPVAGLSLGQYKKLQLALALALPARLLLVDEPFNGLDVQAVDVLEAALARRAGAGTSCIVLTSHLDLRLAPTATLDLDAQPGVL
ncbi:ABC transporter ATP-binding protein [Massilia putida]|uniref:ABC transporter ATP-binding protein n=1 Tax=Massilia putida TaxID=1141883 RepID=UPI0009514B61|nr:ATP-binding cassette domain-containing protein [Massilia putida]